jgi:hypothetical protein
VAVQRSALHTNWPAVTALLLVVKAAVLRMQLLGFLLGCGALKALLCAYVVF